ncbi:MAG: tyrosine-type recombinase/integrase [Phycisphaerales bacterium]|jgi:site-specific recombinase XerD
MGLWKQVRSPYWWMRLPRRHGERARCESTKIPHSPASAAQRKINRELAEDAYHARLGDLARAHYDLPPREPDAAPTDTLASWLDWYAQHVTPTHRGHEREMEIVRRWHTDLGTVKLGALTRERIVEWMTTRAAKVSGSTINRELDVLKAVLRRAVEHGKLTASPIVGLRRMRVVTPQRRLMTWDEETRILAAMKHADDRALLIMALDTLCRLGDCLDLRRADDRGEWLWIPDPKANGGYQVPVTARLRAALDAIPGKALYYFTRRRMDTDRLSRKGVAQMFAAACKAAGVDYGRAAGGLTWHWATRRTTATRLIQAGVDLATVQRAGHWRRPAVVLGIYAGTDDDRVRAALADLRDPAIQSVSAQPEHAKSGGNT